MLFLFIYFLVSAIITASIYRYRDVVFFDNYEALQFFNSNKIICQLMLLSVSPIIALFVFCVLMLDMFVGKENK